MQFCSVSVRLGGSPNHVVAQKRVSVPEIKILQAIHGNDAVLDVVPIEEVNVTSNEERERLKLAYEPAQVEEQRDLVNKVFGPVTPLPQTLQEIGMDPRAEARRLRERALSLVEAADKMESISEDGEGEAEDAPVSQDDDVDFGEDPEFDNAKE